MAVEFHDFSVSVKAAIDDAMKAYLYEAAGELEAQTKRNVPGGNKFYPQQKNAWTYKVDESKGEAVVGNPLESSLWTEFGTGEYALHGDGRKGYWVYVNDGSVNIGSSYTYKGGKQYTLQEAKETVAYLRAKGLDAHYTKGQTPKRPLFKAFESLKEPLKKRAEQILKGRLK